MSSRAERAAGRDKRLGRTIGGVDGKRRRTKDGSLTDILLMCRRKGSKKRLEEVLWGGRLAHKKQIKSLTPGLRVS